MSDAQIFDPANELLVGQQSPQLEPIKPSFEVVETPPPIASRDSSLEPSEVEEEEWAYGSHPNAEKQALKCSAGPASRGQEENPRKVVEDGQYGTVNNYANRAANNISDNVKVWNWVDIPKANGVHNSTSKTESKSSAPAPELAPTKVVLDVKPPPRPPQIKTRPTEEVSYVKSPALARFSINHANGDPSNTLPAIQMSIPRTSSAGSPEPRETLPSLAALTTALIDAGTPFSASSPSFTRVSPGQMSQHGPPSPCVVLPAGLPTHPSFWRRSARAGSKSMLPDCAIILASGSVSSSTSSILHQSPAVSHSIPTTTSPNQVRMERSVEQVLSPESDEHKVDGMNGSFSNNSYKCNILICTAAPFQTQYLLNSHMNVHSDTRPHFCPVKGCARSLDGRGFKRKNEMLRHGLVHISPGYMCPFCPDQQHNHPRPDNLQRHVRVHHVDKGSEDPLLRAVLAQRPEGGSRGRRRRLGS